MSRAPSARCPLCTKEVRTFIHHRRRIFYAHGPNIHAADTCPASGWLVEDHEIIGADDAGATAA